MNTWYWYNRAYKVWNVFRGVHPPTDLVGQVLLLKCRR